MYVCMRKRESEREREREREERERERENKRMLLKLYRGWKPEFSWEHNLRFLQGNSCTHTHLYMDIHTNIYELYTYIKTQIQIHTIQTYINTKQTKLTQVNLYSNTKTLFNIHTYTHSQVHLQRHILHSYTKICVKVYNTNLYTHCFASYFDSWYLEFCYSTFLIFSYCFERERIDREK